MKRLARRPRILIADDAQGIISQVEKLLGSDFEIIGVARDGEQAVQLNTTLGSDILILDISMPILNGIEVASRLGQSGTKPKIVFLTCHEDPDYVETAFSLGAFGYVLKYRITSDLVPAIKAALRGDKFMSQFMAQIPAHTHTRP
jgi:DNA-binding NarL/FixJ family response regulator